MQTHHPLPANGQQTISSRDGERDAFLESILPLLTSSLSPPIQQELFLLAVSEALCNAAEHGNQNAHHKKICVSWIIRSGLALFSIQDSGNGYTPQFADLQTSNGSRGRGLALIRENTDSVFFNAIGNRIFLLKGAPAMKIQHKSYSATVSELPNSIVLFTDISFPDQKTCVTHGLSELLEDFYRPEVTYLVDIRDIRLISSMGWGAVFARAEQDDVKGIVLFNANGTICKTAAQMGIHSRGYPYSKITVTDESSAVLQAIASEPVMAKT